MEGRQVRRGRGEQSGWKQLSEEGKKKVENPDMTKASVLEFSGFFLFYDSSLIGRWEKGWPLSTDAELLRSCGGISTPCILIWIRLSLGVLVTHPNFYLISPSLSVSSALFFVAAVLPNFPLEKQQQ